MLTVAKKPKNTGIRKAERQKNREIGEARAAKYRALTFEQKLARQPYGGKVYRKLMAQSERGKL